MQVRGIDPRRLGEQGYGGNFVVFIHEGEDDGLSMWSIDSLLLTDTDLPQALAWLRDNLPEGCCWSLAVVLSPRRPTPDARLDVAWIVGDDVLTTPPEWRDDEERRVAAEMLQRRHRVDLV